jgi:hypothetical protein
MTSENLEYGKDNIAVLLATLHLANQGVSSTG